MHGSCNGGDEPNGSKAVTLLLRLASLGLALTSAVVMATASECTINEQHGATAKVTVTFKDYPPFVYVNVHHVQISSSRTSYIIHTLAYACRSRAFLGRCSYLVWSSIAAAVLESAGIYLKFGNGEGDDEEGPKLPMVLLVVIDVVVQALLFSVTGAVFAAEVAYGPQINACGGGAGRFCDQVRRSKLLSFGASFSAALAAVAKDVPLPFSVWPGSSD
ncbi:hypothetical protein EJB05_53734, partial [Eragrostis curvula]